MHQQDTFPSKMFDIIQEIANLSVEGNYLFRGEPKHHCKISSTLYRECERIVKEAELENELSDFNIEAIEEEILNQVKRFIPRSENTPDFLSVFTQLQHYDSQTNLIDFTTDFHIALFFACDGQPGENGRVILQKRTLVPIKQPSGVGHRVLAQKSVFVQPERGYIDPNEAKYKVVNIPAGLKEDILEYLRNAHGITTETIYNDIHGYIRTKDIHQFAYGEFYIAFAYQVKAEGVEEDTEEKHALWDKAIKHYSKAIDYNPNFHPAYAKRGTLYWKKGEYDKAIQDRLKAWEDSSDIDLDSDIYRDAKGSWMVNQDPVRALNRILESYDYLEYDEGASEGIIRLRVKVKETCLEVERDSAIMHHIKNELELATGRFYVPILNPVSGSPSEEVRDTRWRYFTLHEKDRPRRMEKELSETEELMKEFWTGLREYMNDNGSNVNCPAPTTRNYLHFSIGRTNFFIRAWLVSSTKEIRIWLYMRGNDATAHFHLLEEQQEEIHNEFGETLEWYELPENESSRICLNKGDTDPLDESDWLQQYEWFTVKLERFNQVFRPRIQALNAADWIPEEDSEQLAEP